MKLLTAITFSLVATASAFAPAPVQKTSTSLNLNNEQTRRAAFGAISTGLIASTFPSAAFALTSSDYKPKYEDMRQIYGLALSLDSLKKSVSDPDTSESALVGLRSFNRDSNFYTNYARNFISKSVKNNADADVRVGYIRQASSVVCSIQELLEGRQGLFGADAAKEATIRVEKAQSLIAKFLAESGVEDERFPTYIKAHP